jgi:hypothetical protein
MGDASPAWPHPVVVLAHRMSFRDHRLAELLKKYGIGTREEVGLFARCPPVPPTDTLADLIRYSAPLASSIGTEKARSELIVVPILLEMKRVHCPAISLFSGIELIGDQEAGLTGVCDFLLSRGLEQLFVTAPVVALVEAKDERLREGLTQCVAEMIAARIFNQREGNEIPVVYGVVTTGTVWKFLGLDEHTLLLDTNEYSVTQLAQVLGILVAMTSGQPISA